VYVWGLSWCCAADDDDDADTTVNADAAAEKPASSKPKVEQWTAAQVAEWLRSLGDQIGETDDVVKRFTEDEVDGRCVGAMLCVVNDTWRHDARSTLLLLDKADLVRLGVVKIGPQKKLTKAIEELKSK
jgi:hypothetical protein